MMDVIKNKVPSECYKNLEENNFSPLGLGFLVCKTKTLSPSNSRILKSACNLHFPCIQNTVSLECNDKDSTAFKDSSLGWEDFS